MFVNRINEWVSKNYFFDACIHCSLKNMEIFFPLNLYLVILFPGAYSIDFIFLSWNNRDDVTSQTHGCSGALQKGLSVVCSFIRRINLSSGGSIQETVSSTG